MMDLRLEVAKIINYNNMSAEKMKDIITVVPPTQKGDFALPCFSFAKEERKAPFVIAKEIAENLSKNNLIKKTEVVGGYLNFFLNRQVVANKILTNFDKDDFFADKEDKKHIVVEYSSPNLAKFMHIGHYNCTVYGETIARMHEFFGHKVTRINYVGDYGTPFGKMVVAFMLWGNKQDIETRGVEATQDLYVKFNQNETEELLEKARYASKQIEEKKGEEYQIYKMLINTSIDKIKEIIAKLGISFDDWRGESTYNNQLKGIVEELKDKKIATESRGAIIVDLEDVNLGVSVVERSDGGSLYITRDLVAIADRYERYNFDKHIYVTALQQDLHFAQLIEITKRLQRPYKDKLEHASYGMFSTPEGKIASRKGKQALLEDILNEATNKARAIIENRNLSKEEKENVALEIAKGAMAFSIFKVEASKDKIFDLQSAISFDGDTAPYLQYTYARCNSLIKKSQSDSVASTSEVAEEVDFFETDRAFEILKQIANFKQTIFDSYKRYEPSLIARAMLDLAKEFNSLYAETQILNSSQQREKIKLVKIVAQTLKTNLALLCINVIEQM
jgi:arginyl-tRNA synthetase